MIIEKNIPLPKAKRQYGSLREKSEQVFEKMEVGDSVFFEGAKQSSNEIVYARLYFSRENKKHTARKVEGGIRVWRTG